MPGSAFGKIFRLTTFGESHGAAIGGIVEGCPAGLSIDLEFISRELLRRRPGQSAITTPRKEDDTVEFLSGIFEGKSTGTPIGFIIRNNDQKSGDYEKLKDVFRPSHADMVYEKKYGIRDYRGGGRSSARETASRVVAGAIAKLMLAKSGIKIHAFVKQVGDVILEKNFESIDLARVEENIVRCPDPDVAQKMVTLIEDTRKSGDSVGGAIQCVILGLPAGLGEPVFDKFHACLAHAVMSINATRAFEIGSGFAASSMKGSEHNDAFINSGGEVKTTSNNSGGVQGGITNGMPVYFNVAFKPVATIAKEQKTVNKAGESINLSAEGRHDPCVVPRAVPIVESMAALVAADMLLQANTSKMP